jgi:hypothetical protein
LSSTTPSSSCAPLALLLTGMIVDGVVQRLAAIRAETGGANTTAR